MGESYIRFLKKAFNLPYSVTGVRSVEVLKDPFREKDGLQGVKFKDGEITFTFESNRVMVIDETHLYAIYRTLKHLDWFEWLK